MDFKQFSKLIMIEQTLFALPFAYIGVLFAGGNSFSVWFWVTFALISARTAGMSFNRAIDANIDAKNPRTKDRIIPLGEVKPIVVWAVGIISLIILIFSSFMLNTLCFHLSFLASFMLFLYSFFKRFSSSSHFFLGIVEAAAPIGGYLAVKGEFDLFSLLLGFIILMWIAGLDILYAIQDIEFDIKSKLYSIPSKLGRKNAHLLSFFCYICSILSMILAGFITGKGHFYWAGIIFIGIIFACQQIIANTQDVSIAMKHVFRLNMFISPIFFLSTFIDVLGL